MAQTTLNLLAILVGLMTFTVLLGPLLAIPPALPAIATFGLLGLTTVDQLGWQGRGTGLLLDWWAQQSPQYRQRLIHHEAGHFLVAHQLGIPIMDYTLSAWEAFKKGHPGQGGVVLAAPDALDQSNFDPYATAWMAGIAAERLVYGEAEGGSSDYQQLQRFSQALGKKWQIQERQSTLAAQTILRDRWDSYQALVTAMAQRASLTECQQILQFRAPV